MALGSTIYSFDIDLADSDRSVYESLYVSIGADTVSGTVVRHAIGA